MKLQIAIRKVVMLFTLLSVAFSSIRLTAYATSTKLETVVPDTPRTADFFWSRSVIAGILSALALIGLAVLLAAKRKQL